MKQDSNPSREHRPNRWARLKKQLNRARTDRDTATHLKELAYLYICQEDLWDDFTEWIAGKDTAHPCNPVFEFIGTQARQLNDLNQQLTLTQSQAEMYKKSEQWYYGLLGKKDEQIDRLISMVADLANTTVKQREEIARLKKQRQHNECPDEGNATDRPE